MTSLRDLGRADNWWDYKIPPVLAIAYASALLYGVPAAAIARCLALIVFVGVFAGAYGHIVNDVFDVEADRNAGKRNRMASFAPWQRFGLCLLTIGLGFAPAIFFRYSRLSLALLAVEYLLPTIYSMPPMRLKERGVLGVLCDSLGAHAVPCLYSISVLANEGSRPGIAHMQAWVFPLVAALWALCLGVKGIVIHEFEDRAGDLQAGVSTFATGRDFISIRRTINRIYALELLAFLTLLILLFPVAPTLAAVAIVYLAMIRFRFSRRRDFYVYGGSDEAAVACWRFSHAFYENYFPIVLAIHCALRYPWLAFLPVLQILAFRNGFLSCLSALRDFGAQLRVWLIWKGQLHLDDFAEALVERGPPRSTRVRIVRTGSHPWHIRLTHPYRVRGCATYSLRFEARADRARQVTVGTWQDHAPWNSMGLCREVSITERWTPLELSFAAIEDEDRAYAGLWLGAATGFVEIRSWSLVKDASRKTKGAPVRASSAVAEACPVYAIASYWNLTGVHVFLEHLLRGLTARGTDARLLLTENSTDLVQLPSDLLPLPHDISVEALPVDRTASWAAHWVTLIRLLSERAPCIFLPNVDYRHSCISPKLPASVCVVGIIQSDDPVHYEHVARLGRYWDAIVCVSETCAAKVIALDPTLKPRLHVIPNAVPVPPQVPFRTTSADRLRPLRVMYHGGMNTYQKRILDLAGVLFECERRQIPVTMTVAGDGSERDEFLRLCAPHIKSGALRYVGLVPHDDVEAMLRENDVYLLPSAFEGMPHAMLEAMAQGCVPVVTDIESAVPELIRDGVNGYRVPVGDIGAFADRLKLLHSDPELRLRMASEAHRTLLGSPYDIAAMVKSYARVFEQVVEAARSGAYRRPSGPILPPPREVAGVSIFPMEHGRWAVQSAERWLAGPRERVALRVERILRHFIATG